MTIQRRCRPDDVCMSDAMPFQQHWEVRTTYALKECINNSFLLDVRGRIRAGDIVRMCRYVNDTWQEVVEIAEVSVLAVDNSGVDIVLTRDIATYGTAPVSGIAVGRGFAGQFVVRIDGTIDKKFNTKIEAEEYAELKRREVEMLGKAA